MQYKSKEVFLLHTTFYQNLKTKFLFKYPNSDVRKTVLITEPIPGGIISKISHEM